jgi:large subunit ribosomal protein L15
MKLHDLRPATGAHKARTRVGRGIAAGKGKTAGRGTKGQKARAGGTIPAWFEGGQTPIHIRIPKLRGFKNRNRIDYEVVNLGRISQLVELGELELAEMPGAKSTRTSPITINQEILRAVGLVRTLNKPLKILGNGEVNAALFVVADAFTRSAVSKIEAAGGSVQVLEIPSSPMAALTGTALATDEADGGPRESATGRRAGTTPAAGKAVTGAPAKAMPKVTAESTVKSGRTAAGAATSPAPKSAAEAAPRAPRPATGEATAADVAPVAEPADDSGTAPAVDQMPAGEAG